MNNKQATVRYDYLEELATILETADEEHAKKNEPGYRQMIYIHPCGSPGCALGHWAVAHPDRWIVNVDLERVVFRYAYGKSILSSTASEFGITDDEAEELIGIAGCGDARTAKEAATYIRAFIAVKRGGS